MRPAAKPIDPFVRRRIGVLTFHRCVNYGSYWQARCLLEGLKERGHDAVLLDHRSRRATWAEWRCAFQPTLPVRSPRSDYSHYGAKTRRVLRAVDQLPRSPAFPLEALSPPLDRETIVVGSDEVWNLAHPWYGGQGLFFGDGLADRRVVSYAASFGNYDAAAGLTPHWSERLRKFEAISVRDDNSRRLIHEAVGREAELVLDPVLQFPPRTSRRGSDWDDVPHRPYVAVYGHGFPAWFVEAVRAAARRRRQTLVSVGYRNDWADEQQLAAGPNLFADLIKGAAAVATNFFHGCVFALNERKPFACVTTPYRANKIRDLTSLLGASERLVDERSAPAIPRLLSEPPNADVFNRIGALRGRSQQFLERAVG